MVMRYFADSLVLLTSPTLTPGPSSSPTDSTCASTTSNEKQPSFIKAFQSKWSLTLDSIRRRLAFETDLRARLHPHLSRFLGFRAIHRAVDHEPFPVPPFSWLKYIPLRYEFWILATVGSFVGILLIEAIMSSSTTFRDVSRSPLIISSFGASAVLVFAVTEAPLAQPANLVLGQLIPTVLATAITKLWLMSHPDYTDHLNSQEFYTPSFVNGALCMSLALLVQMVLGIVHPPGGATALAAATEPTLVAIGWYSIPVVLASCLIMLGWALLINNVGRKRYPMYWWVPGGTFVAESEQSWCDLEAGEPSRSAPRGDEAEVVVTEDLVMTETACRCTPT